MWREGAEASPGREGAVVRRATVVQSATVRRYAGSVCLPARAACTMFSPAPPPVLLHLSFPRPLELSTTSFRRAECRSIDTAPAFLPHLARRDNLPSKLPHRIRRRIVAEGAGRNALKRCDRRFAPLRRRDLLAIDSLAIREPPTPLSGSSYMDPSRDALDLAAPPSADPSFPPRNPKDGGPPSLSVWSTRTKAPGDIEPEV
ncbi:hypothetical protein DFH09DRAFT_1310123 [Mycena vulgaris]|nr:hypothetical protein DFH09DRAFT_1310123 [Mycena vulgaris]